MGSSSGLTQELSHVRGLCWLGEDNKATEMQLHGGLKHAAVGRRCLLPAKAGATHSKEAKKNKKTNFSQARRAELTHGRSLSRLCSSMAQLAGFFPAWFSALFKIICDQLGYSTKQVRCCTVSGRFSLQLL